VGFFCVTFKPVTLNLGGFEILALPFIAPFTGVFGISTKHVINYSIMMVLAAVWLGIGIWLRKKPAPIGGM
jgi:hypothetical protein